MSRLAVTGCWSLALVGSAAAALVPGTGGAARARMPTRVRVFDKLFSAVSAGAPSAPMRTDLRALGAAPSAPSWEALRERALGTPTGARLAAEDEARRAGGGPAHRASTLRLFGRPESEVRLTLYRDSAAWCPYCQKVWLQLELKQVPYRVELINMRSYGDKPDAFLAKVPGGLLPAIELDGALHTESLLIMQLIERAFPEAAALLPQEEGALRRANELLKLERELFAHWCQLTFRPGLSAAGAFERALDRVDGALAEAEGPWMLGGERPSLVDLQYVSHVERMAASVPYWKGLVVRGRREADGSLRWPAIERWFEAFEALPAYMATKSDWYTHVQDIPPQYGPGQPAGECAAFRRSIDGEGGAWRLPLRPTAASEHPADVLQPGWEAFEQGAPHEAAWRLIANHAPVTRFALRGAGAPGAKRFGAALADPYATPAQGEIEGDVDALLRHVAAWLLDAKPTPDDAALAADLRAGDEGGREPAAACARYLRDRVGVPRDMSYPAARQLRAHLNWAADQLCAQAGA